VIEELLVSKGPVDVFLDLTESGVRVTDFIEVLAVLYKVRVVALRRGQLDLESVGHEDPTIAPPVHVKALL
jgi:hypothetical protein